jgi:hypothetical protein
MDVRESFPSRRSTKKTNQGFQALGPRPMDNWTEAEPSRSDKKEGKYIKK